MLLIGYSPPVLSLADHPKNRNGPLNFPRLVSCRQFKQARS
jgi:hypothetical protein